MSSNISITSGTIYTVSVGFRCISLQELQYFNSVTENISFNYNFLLREINHETYDQIHFATQVVYLNGIYE